jgi:hypothetical protein
MNLPHTKEHLLTLRKRAAIACLAAGALAVPATAQAAEQLAGVTDDNQLVLFRSDSPANLQYAVPITGLPAGERVVGIDERPATGELYALGASSRLYRIDPSSGDARPLGNAFTPSLTGTGFGFDINPVGDRARVVSDADQNLRLNPDNGDTVATDTTLQYAAGDPGAGSNPSIGSAAYTNSVLGATTTTLYDIDTARDALVTQDPANDGVLHTVGALGLDVTEPAAMDIGATGNAYAALRRAGQTTPELFRVNLQTGAATAAGPIAARTSSRATGDSPVVAIAVTGSAPDDRTAPASSLSLSSTQLERRLLGQGLLMTVACNEACSATATASLAGSEVGKAQGQVPAGAGQVRLRVPLSEAARSRVRARGTVLLSVEVSVTDAAGNRSSTTRLVRSRG